MGCCCSSAIEREEDIEATWGLYTVQRDRFEHYELWDKEKNEKQVSEFLQLESRLREIAQRELAIKEARTGTGTGTGDTSLDPLPESMREELERLKAEYFIVGKKRDRVLETFNYGYLGRGMQSWRERKPEVEWWFHRTLVQDCAGRGGCCGRDCGCCRDRTAKLGSERKAAVGHCTIECGCCVQARGFRFTDQLKEEMRDLYPLHPDKDAKYFRKIMLASIFGIEDGCRKSPVDLIEKGPGPSDDFLEEPWCYDQSASACGSDEDSETTGFDVNQDYVEVASQVD